MVAARCPQLFASARLEGWRSDRPTGCWSVILFESRAPMAPTLTEWASRPLVGNRTLRGSVFSSLGLEPLEGHPYLVRDRSI
jgi:hypothetical protein